jgi:hypothetical protein
MLRNITLGIIMATIGLVSTNKVNAQAFEKGGTYLNLGLGASNFWHIDVQNNWPGYGGWRGSNVGGITLQMEWGIHKYVGLGFATGVQGGIGRHAWYGPGNNYGELAVPFGLIVNFHFYQLIEDKTTKDIHGDKLDIYAGLNVGSGISYFPRPNWIAPLFFAGPQVGAKYYVAPKVALGLELGWGKTYVNGGVTFKL